VHLIMANKRANRAARVGTSNARPASTARGGVTPEGRASGSGVRRWSLFAAGVLVILMTVVAWGVASSRPGASGPVAGGSEGTLVEANGGHWTNITPDTLAAMLLTKDFTLLNVKTPYMGEIAGTDLYIPYNQLAGRAAELPMDKSARITVYCRSGSESAIAAQTLIDLGYTNIDNLDGGMTAWTASGRQLVQLNRP
jgi:rhodanese-related sulfurtransferase